MGPYRVVVVSSSSSKSYFNRTCTAARGGSRAADSLDKKCRQSVARRRGPDDECASATCRAASEFDDNLNNK